MVIIFFFFEDDKMNYINQPNNPFTTRCVRETNNVTKLQYKKSGNKNINKKIKKQLNTKDG